MYRLSCTLIWTTEESLDKPTGPVLDAIYSTSCVRHKKSTEAKMKGKLKGNHEEISNKIKVRPFESLPRWNWVIFWI